MVGENVGVIEMLGVLLGVIEIVGVILGVIEGVTLIEALGVIPMVTHTRIKKHS